MFGHGVFTPLFRTFMACDIPSYYKIFLTAYLCSYTSGGTYLIVFSVAAIAHIVDAENEFDSISYFSPAGIIVLNVIAFYVIGYVTFLFSLLRMHYINKNLLFPEYRKKCCGALYIVFVNLRYSLVFQFLFYTVTSITFYFLGSMDHLLSRPNICSATNKDSILMSRCTAFYEMAKFNIGSWGIALFIAVLAYMVVMQDESWDWDGGVPENVLKHALFSGPALFLSLMCFVSPIVLNPFILGWPFYSPPKDEKGSVSKDEQARLKPEEPSRKGGVLGLNAFLYATTELDDEMERAERKPDLELGTIRDLFSADGTNPGGSPKRMIHPALASRQYSDGRNSIGSNIYHPSKKTSAPLENVTASDENKRGHSKLDKKARKMTPTDTTELDKKARKLTTPQTMSFAI
jgi:hypothetical protein